MKYLLLIYQNPGTRQIWDSLSDEERSEGLEFYRALNEELATSGELIVAESLADESQGTRVSVTGGQMTKTDGPFAETKEQLAGIYLLECDSAVRAQEIAGRLPEADRDLGFVEVRPVMTYRALEM